MTENQTTTVRRSHRVRRTDRAVGDWLASSCEQLEPRTLLSSYSLADYLPVSNGDAFTFAGIIDGEQVTTTQRVVGNPDSSGGAKVVVSYDVYGRPGSTTIALKRTASGLQQDTGVANSFGSGYSVSAAPTIQLFPTTFSDGDHFPISSNVTVTSIGGLSASGKMTGDTVVLSPETLTTPAGTFQTIRIRNILHLVVKDSSGGTHSGTASFDWWLVKNMAVVRFDFAINYDFDDTVGGTTGSVQLTESSLLAKQPEAVVRGKTRTIQNGDSTPRTADGSAFGSLPKGESKKQTFVLRNLNSKGLALHISRISIVGAHAGDFSIVKSPATKVNKGAQTTFDLVFTPKGSGLRTATVRITSNDPNDSDYTFQINGKGVQTPRISIRGNGRVISDGDTTPAVKDFTSFTNAKAGKGGSTRSFIIKNTGDAPLSFVNSGISLSGAKASNFEIVSIPQGTIAPNETATVLVQFSPKTKGKKRATLVIATNAYNIPVYTFDILGKGV